MRRAPERKSRNKHVKKTKARACHCQKDRHKSRSAAAVCGATKAEGRPTFREPATEQLPRRSGDAALSAAAPPRLACRGGGGGPSARLPDRILTRRPPPA